MEASAAVTTTVDVHARIGESRGKNRGRKNARRKEKAGVIFKEIKKDHWIGEVGFSPLKDIYEFQHLNFKLTTQTFGMLIFLHGIGPYKIVFKLFKVS